MNCRKIKIVSYIIVMSILLPGCSKEKVYDNVPLMGLSWFQKKDEIMEMVASLELVEERENNGKQMLDYNGAELFGISVTVTLCFDDRGLIGINYHDTKKGKNYVGWQRSLEDRYGIANENSTGCASWFENPVGANTCVYLFQMNEYIQISFYATEDTPDKQYKRVRPSGGSTHLY